MKRITPVLLGALAGALGLPILMFACRAVVHPLFPLPPGTTMSWEPLSYDGLAFSSFGRTILLSGFALGAWSVVLWRGQRTFRSLLGSAVCSAGAGARMIWWLAADFRNMSSFAPPVKRELLLREAAFDFPAILWALAVLFFALTARRKSVMQ